jgi:hypothetical protein
VTASRSSIQIQWTAPDNGGSAISNYHVYEAPGTTPAAQDFAFVSDTGYTLTYTKSIGLVAGQTYNFKVLAVNLVGQGPLSPAVARLAATVPNPPTNLVMVSQSTTSISFSWTEASDNGGSIVTDF